MASALPCGTPADVVRDFFSQAGHGKIEKMSRKQRKERKNRGKKLRGTARTKKATAAK